MALELINVTKGFDKKILDNISITFPEGKTTVIYGPSGCGKTTILNVILGLTKVDSGLVNIPKNTKFSTVFQEDRLLNSINVLENLMAVNNNKEWCVEISKKVELLEDLYKYPKELSGGMKRRLAIARAMAYNGDVYILDEPSKGLDVGLRKRITLTLKEALEGKTTILVTHNSKEAVEMADILLYIKGSPLKVVETVMGKEEIVDFLKKMESDF
ncbi:MAG: ATP-binding cassette domain-containing protein [Anaerotignaceae bacterium]